MSRHPYYILEDILKHARRFIGSETQLIEHPPGGPYPFFQPLCRIEEGLASHGHWLNHFYLEYKIRLSGLSANPFSIALRRAIERMPEMVETRFQNWDWAYALTPDGLHEIRERLRAHRESTYLPLLDAALSWRLGRNVARHEAADQLAGEAEKLGIKPTMTAEEGEKVIWDQHRVWYMTPALAVRIPTVSPEEHGELGEAVDELERQFRRLESPEKLKEYAERLDQEVKQTPYELPHLGHKPDGSADGTEAPRIEPSPSPPTVGVDGNQIVLLIHGIRTQADWGPMVRSRLEIPGQIEVVPIKYGYFDTFRFWFPFWTRRGPIERVHDEIRVALQKYRKTHRDAKLSIIAHSFGTYVVGKILQRHFDLHVHRLILCGSVLPQGFPWNHLQGRFDDDNVVNECGKTDIWPVLAKAISWGYGASGTHGFGAVLVKDRYHGGGHGQYFDSEFVEKYWEPFIRRGEYQGTDLELKMPPTPGWISVLGIMPLKWVTVLVVLAATIMAGYAVVNAFKAG